MVKMEDKKMREKAGVTADEIKKLVEKTIKETIREEFLKLRMELIPEISDEEMKEIEKKYKSPDKRIVYSESIDI